ncbi:DUF3592 domain-containing protein [Pseudomonas sp. AA-38]|uniref:DUF3592 domain-containing protein n=1 Tax=Pseudomonas sp. AA-38 TaxID=3028807 RepID=UPI0023F94DA5|nr:DUF3592 domain-containing protein [Pseudomonas sp. AA-38]
MNDRWLWAFPVLGGIFILLALLLQIHRWNAEEQMLRTTGEVVAVMGRGCPVVEFFPHQGELTRFTGEVCSRPGYAMGEVVDLFYDPLEPENAHIDSFVQNWFISLILGAVGLFFCLVGSFLLMPDSFSNRRVKRLESRAQAVQAKFVDVRRNPFSTLNDVPAWQLVCQWHNPESGAMHVFYSEDLWFDPRPFIKDECLQVMIDPEDPRHYSVDTSFLPRLAV